MNTFIRHEDRRQYKKQKKYTSTHKRSRIGKHIKLKIHTNEATCVVKQTNKRLLDFGSLTGWTRQVYKHTYIDT